MTEMTEERLAMPVEVEKISESDGLLLDERKPFDFFFDEKDGVNGIGEVAVNISLTRSGEDVFAAGQLSGVVRLQCGRCLEEFDQELVATVEEPFFPKSTGLEGAAETDEEAETTPDEGNLYDGNTLDLFDVLRDQLYLAIPLKPLCKEDCKGLCPNCGANLNAGPCGCKPKKADPRLAVLKSLKEKL